LGLALSLLHTSQVRYHTVAKNRQTLGRFRDRDDIASLFNCVLAKLVVANVRWVLIVTTPWMIMTRMLFF